jgi:protoheme IX farnesyltransferase
VAYIEDSRNVAAIAGGARVGDYVALLKPKVMSLVVFTAVVGLFLAPGPINPIIAAISILCIAVGAGASGALNMWYDSDIDAVMSRTLNRPIPSGRVDRNDALALGVVLSGFSVFTLGLAANWLAAGLLAFTIFFYAVVYTMWLKRSTPQNIVIGGAAGAFPPMVGWVAVTGSIDLSSALLFLIIFLWTPPHFWALALYRADDYRKAGLPMLPITHGNEFTRLHVFLYTLVLFAATLLPFISGMSGVIYLAAAIVLGGMFSGYAWKLLRRYSDSLARRTFRFSIVYLAALFAALLVDHYASPLLWGAHLRMAA